MEIDGMSTRVTFLATSPRTFFGCAGKRWISWRSPGDSPGITAYPWRGGRRWRGWMSLSGPSTEESGRFRGGVRDQDGGDVVAAAGVDGEPHHVVGGAERVGQRAGQREAGQFGRVGQVVPQAVGAHEQDPGPGRSVSL